MPNRCKLQSLLAVSVTVPVFTNTENIKWRTDLQNKTPRFIEKVEKQRSGYAPIWDCHNSRQPSLMHCCQTFLEFWIFFTFSPEFDFFFHFSDVFRRCFDILDFFSVLDTPILNVIPLFRSYSTFGRYSSFSLVIPSDVIPGGIFRPYSFLRRYFRS